MKKALVLGIICWLMLIYPLAAQEKGDKLKALMEKREYVFVAMSVMPQGDGDTQRILNALSQGAGGAQLTQLNGEYSLKVTKKSVESDLPFFGRAFNAPTDPTKGGIKFKSEDFEYTQKFNKKRGWEINIKPKDVFDINYLSLTISDNGYGNLFVVSNQKSQISFYGYITTHEDK